MNIREAFGSRIKELRKEKKLSQEKLALKADIDRTYMTSVENGKRNISIQNIDKILSALNISYSLFFDSELFNSDKKRTR
jgi:transcriptional regulator with XRE-family HTH domain